MRSAEEVHLPADFRIEPGKLSTNFNSSGRPLLGIGKQSNKCKFQGLEDNIILQRER